MLKGFVRLAACAASGAAFLALTGCGGAAPDEGYAGPPPSSYDRGASAPVLMGQTGPAQPSADGLAGGPRGGAAAVGAPVAATSSAPRFQLITRRKADGTLQISMRPIANPEDMTPAERRQVYGNRYAPRAVAAAPRRVWRATPVAKPAPAIKPAPKPVATAPLRPAAPAPVVTSAPAAAAAPVVAAAPKPNPTQQLQSAVSAGINRGASLSVPADLKAGKEADVVLSLPGDLLAMVQEQAAKLGLGKAAKKVNAYANLQGQGYEISPPGQQTAPVAAGKPTTFTWKVKPTQAEKAPLRADYGLELNGAKPKTAFSVGSIEEAVAAPVEAAKSAAKGFKFPKLSMPKMPSLKALAFPWVPVFTLPGGDKLARETLVGGVLALLALILLVVLARGAGASRARNERRRKFRTMQDYGVNQPEHDAHATSYVNPMIAAAAGGVAGYTFASQGHDDHGHDDHGHGHDDHGHGGHADGDHGQDDHDHGHDDHGAHHTSHDAAGHDGHGEGHGHDDHAAGHDDHGHGHDDHGAGHGHDGHDGHHTALTSHGHDDHGHGGHDGPGHDDGHGHDDHGHDDGHGHGHGDHGPAQHIAHAPVSGHDDHGHGEGHDAPGHGHDDHGHDSHGHDDHHGHDQHHHEPAHAH